jgi:hypothetical protein
MAKRSVKVDGLGERKDEGKLPVDLIPADVIQAIAAVFQFGATKYARRNWERGLPWSKAYGPMQRHALDFALGRRVDRESGLLTSAHMACDALMLCAFDIRGMNHLDDLEPFARAVLAQAARGKK